MKHGGQASMFKCWSSCSPLVPGLSHETTLWFPFRGTPTRLAVPSCRGYLMKPNHCKYYTDDRYMSCSPLVPGLSHETQPNAIVKRNWSNLQSPRAGAIS